MIAIDTNVLIYAHRSETEQHEAAAGVVTELAQGDQPWAIPVFCITEFLRVVTHARVFNPPSSIAQALDFLDALADSPSCRIPMPGENFLGHLAKVVRQAQATGNLIFDAQIAALCQEHGIPSILTNDRDFERFSGLDIHYLPA